MEALKLYWLGHPQVELNGHAIKLETRKAAAMLAYLSLESGESPRELLSAMFWPEANQQKALANLRRTLSSLNASLPGWLEADRNTIALKRKAKLWVDVETFEGLLLQRQEHCQPAKEVCDECLLTLDRALKLYQGDFLEGLNLRDCPSFDEWQFFQRDGLRQKFGDVLQRLSYGHSQRSQWDQAILYARQWLSLDRLHEPAYRALMELYAHSGLRAAALHQYEELVRLLNEQIGQQPERETRQLYEQIRGPEEAQQTKASSESPSLFPLLKTKLYFPTALDSRIIRSSLVDCLRASEQRALTLISAPAGFGKTTLLAEWIAQTSHPVAWLSLDDGDNDPYRFLSYLITALESVHEGIGAEAQQLMRSSQLIPTHIILASLINDLGKVAEPYVFVLDDYQFITEHAVNDAMAYLLDHLPSNLHLVISTRADPPLQLGRLRAHGQLLELRIQDLRFTLKETTEFLNEVMRLGLSPEDIEALDARTEGWVVGLQMAALSLRGHENASEFIQIFSGSHRYVLDYLVEEVLKRQPAHIQSFLLETSILEKLNGALCEALMTEQWRQSGESSQAVLEYLEKNNLFVIPLDDHKQWFRYHHLFAQLLHSRIAQTSGDLGIQALHERAAAWYHDQGMLEETVFHALVAKNYRLVAQLIERDMQKMLAHGDYDVLLKWIRALPEQVIDSRPWLQIDQARVLGILNRTREMEPILEKLEQQARRNPEDNEFIKITAHISYLRAVIAFKDTDLDQALYHASLAQRQAEKEDPEFSSNLMLLLGSIHLGLGNLQDAARAFSEVTRSLPAIRSLSALLPVFSAMVNLADIHVIRGELGQAETFYHQAQDIAVQWGDVQFHALGRVFISLGNLLYERNDLEMAIGYIQKGIDHYKKWGHASDMANGYASLAQVLQACRKSAEADAAMKKALDETNRSSAGIKATNFVKRQYVQLMMKIEGVGKAEQWLRERGLKNDEPLTFNNEQDYILQARILIMQNQYRTAWNLLNRLAKAAQSNGRNGSLIEILTLQALALQSGNHTDKAYQVMVKALELGEPEGYVRVFINEGKMMRELLQNFCRKLEADSIQLENRERLLVYSNKLLAAFCA